MSASNPTATEFIFSVPPPLNTLIIEHALLISSLKWISQAIFWKKGHRTKSWLFVAAWWSICLFAGFVIKYCLPFLLLLPLVLPVPITAPAYHTEEAIRIALADLLEINGLRQPFSLVIPILKWETALRVTTLLFIPYLALTYLVNTRVIVALLGTLALTWNAQWARLIRHALRRSAWVRFGAFKAWSLLSGDQNTGAFAFRMDNIASSQSVTQTTTNLRLLFTVLENQRWWVGLDWTAALLPAERPSWSTADLQPISPPSTYSLPPSVTSYLPHSENKKLRIKRTASWSWEENEWRIVLKNHDPSSTNNAVTIQRVQKPLPSTTGAPDSTKLAKATSKLKDIPHEVKEEVKSKIETVHHEEDKVFNSEEYSKEENVNGDEVVSQCTDLDGWIYGDNKWENPADKGGMGKYTRYRRWTRIAILHEDTEEVGPGEMGIVRAQPVGEINLPETGRTEELTGEEVTSADVRPASPNETGTAAERLRQRLKAAVTKS